MLRSTRRHFMLLMANRGLDSSNFLWAMASSSQSLKWLEGKPGKPHDIATWNSHYIHRWIGFIGYPSIAMTKVYERDPYLHAWCIWYTYIYIHMYIHTYICICYRVCVVESPLTSTCFSWTWWGLLQEFTPVRPKQKVGGTQDLKAVKPLE